MWRWTAEHPDWEPGEGGADGWEREVTSLAWSGAGPLVLIDPLVPEGDAGESVWAALDELAAAADSVEIVITCHWHGRSGDVAADRYSGTVRIHSGGVARVGYEVGAPFEDGAELPGGIVVYAVARAGGESVLWIEPVRTLVAGDSLLGAEGERTVPLRICPADWVHDGNTFEDLRSSLARLTELPVEAIVPMHGAPVLADAAAVLRGAVEA